jgi:hypothetical protein
LRLHSNHAHSQLHTLILQIYAHPFINTKEAKEEKKRERRGNIKLRNRFEIKSQFNLSGEHQYHDPIMKEDEKKDEGKKGGR